MACLSVTSSKRPWNRYSDRRIPSKWNHPADKLLTHVFQFPSVRPFVLELAQISDQEFGQKLAHILGLKAQLAAAAIADSPQRLKRLLKSTGKDGGHHPRNRETIQTGHFTGSKGDDAMAGWTKASKIQEEYPTREDAIAAVIVMTAKAIESLPKLHPEIDAARKRGLIETQEQSIQIIRESEAWD